MAKKGNIKKNKSKETGFIAIAVPGVFYGLLAWLGIGCPIKYLTGVSCAGCGMTRAWFSVLQMDLSAAFYYHPLFWTIPAAVAVYLFRRKIGNKYTKIIFITMIVMFIITYVLRLGNPNDAVVSIDFQSGALWKIMKKLREIIQW